MLGQAWVAAPGMGMGGEQGLSGTVDEAGWGRGLEGVLTWGQVMLAGCGVLELYPVTPSPTLTLCPP